VRARDRRIGKSSFLYVHGFSIFFFIGRVEIDWINTAQNMFLNPGTTTPASGNFMSILTNLISPTSRECPQFFLPSSRPA
jgi:hypothetical protein